MPNVNVYLPEALHRRVKAAQLPVSEICQEALAGVLDDIQFDVQGEVPDANSVLARQLREIARRLESKP